MHPQNNLVLLLKHLQMFENHRSVRDVAKLLKATISLYDIHATLKDKFCVLQLKPCFKIVPDEIEWLRLFFHENFWILCLINTS